MDAKLVLHTIIDGHAELYPSSIAIEETERNISYEALKTSSWQVSRVLNIMGIQPGEPIGIYLPASAAYVLSAIGVNKAGGMFMPLELNYPVERMISLLGIAQPRMIITDEHHLDQLYSILNRASFQIPVTIILVDINNSGYFRTGTSPGNFQNLQMSSEPLAVSVAGNDSAYLIYTSGSTGMPKMIEGVHKGLSHFIHWEVKEFELDNTVRVSQLAPLSFDVSLRDIFVPLLAGGTLCIPPDNFKRNPDLLFSWLEEKQVNLVHTVPSLFRLLTDVVLNEGKDKTKFIQYILLAGEPLYTKDVGKWRKAAGEKTELVNMYGPSETTLAKVFNRIKQIDETTNEIIPLGTALPNTAILVLHNNRPVMTGAIGEIFIRTPFRSKGYYKDPALTGEKFIQNPLHNNYPDIVYKTGDLGKLLNDGKLAFMGREDRQVKIRGNRVELYEVEQSVQSFPGMGQVFVSPFITSSHDTCLVLYYTNTGTVNETSLQEYLKDRLPEYMHPSLYLHIEEFPLSLNGKIDKNQLPKPEELLYQSLKYEEPKDDTEKRIADIWAKTLGFTKIGRNNSFFELGGHSLAAFKIVAAISKEFDKDISLKEFFDYPKVSDLAKLVKEELMEEIII